MLFMYINKTLLQYQLGETARDYVMYPILSETAHLMPTRCMLICTSTLKKRSQISLLDQNYIFLYQDTTDKGISHSMSLALLLKL